MRRCARSTPGFCPAGSVCLSAMCVPDLLGTQGTFLLFTTRPPAAAFKEGGQRVAIAVASDRVDVVVEAAAVDGRSNAADAGEPGVHAPARDLLLQ